jgi:flagellar motor switch protein FliN/FliY
MSALAGVRVQLSVVLGSTRLPIQQVLKMGRATNIPLD